MNAPRLSVVVPVFNEQDNVAPLIREIVAALRGRAPEDGGDFEIVYVDDPSSDDTLAALRALQADSRNSVVRGKGVSGRGVLGGRRISKHKKIKQRTETQQRQKPHN